MTVKAFQRNLGTKRYPWENKTELNGKCENILNWHFNTKKASISCGFCIFGKSNLFDAFFDAFFFFGSWKFAFVLRKK